tara:strand:+ start:1780 stop:1938 length:159 start_codon:yes stop_codon:yes gene_type:complete
MTAFFKALLSLLTELIKGRVERKDTAGDAETPETLRERWRRHIRDDIDELRD